MYSKEIDSIFYTEIEQIKSYPYWVCAWWKPEYEKNRRKELAQDITSKNRDIEYIEKKTDNQKKQAERWWLNKGQYYNQDNTFYPKTLVIDAYMAGFDVGVIVGKNEIQPKDVADVEGRCRCGEFPHTKLCPLYQYPDRR